MPSEYLKSPVEPEQTKQLGTAPDRDLFKITKELMSGDIEISRTITEDPEEYSVGHSETFWLIDQSNSKAYQSGFTLALVTPNAYWYVEDSLDIKTADLKRSATKFEVDIYPTITQIFGTKWIPGIDKHRRLNILNARLADVAGYFSSADEHPIAVRPNSNQRKIIYVNAADVPPGSSNYNIVVSHELQHAIHWNADASEDTWINEGLSELASSIAIGSHLSISKFLRGSPISLVHWPTPPASNVAHYGAASLFMHFFAEHYASKSNLRDFLAQQKDSIAGIDQYLAEQGYQENFKDVFRQWATANILDMHLTSNSQLLGYEELEIGAVVSGSINGLKEKSSEIPQFALEYTELTSLSKPFQLSFQGNRYVALLPVDVGPLGCWWSNSGDSINSTLSYPVNIPLGSTAVLTYDVWFDIEENWDYAYIEVSIDGGKKWRIIETPASSLENPFGNAFGSGYSGKSGGWLTESVDLTPFAGKEIWARIQYITDDAVNSAGACFRDLSVSVDGLPTNGDQWKAQGFVFTDNIVRQEFQVQLVTQGDMPLVRQLNLDANNSGDWTIAPPEDGDRLIVVVGSMADKTREAASYTLSLTSAKH